MNYLNQKTDFPQDFLWGASTSAYQFEGAYNEDGKGLSVMDVAPHDEKVADFKVAADHYHHYKKDVQLMKEMGLKAYRFSISWSRVIPNGTGVVNPKGLAFYHSLLDELITSGIEPVVTMYHFDLPNALQEKGGWENRGTIDAFEKYAELLLSEFGSKVKYWLVINEQNVMINHPGALNRGGQPSKKSLYQQCHHMFVAQAKAMVKCHEMYPEALIGPAPNVMAVYPATCNPLDSIAANNWASIRCWLYLDIAVYGRYTDVVWKYLVDRGIEPTIEEGDMELLAAAKPDYLAMNYYATATVGASRGDGSDVAARGGDQQIMLGEEGVYRSEPNEYLEKTDFVWAIDPVGLRLTLRQINERYHLPILITENGLGAKDILTEDGKIHDDYRIDFFKKHFEQARLAIADGVNLIGYCPWAAIDLISTHQGCSKRYGFIYVDREEFDLKNLERIRKDSFFWYQQVIASNGKLGI